MKTWSLERLSFQASDSGVTLRSIGDGAYEVNLVDTAAPTAPTGWSAWINIVVVPADMLSSIPEAVRMTMFKGTYMGAGPAEKKATRSIMGQSIEGDAQQGTIPRPCHLEAFLAPLPDGGALFFGTRVVDGFASDVAEAFFAQVAASITVAPE